jgi:hypothetical protein
MKYLAEGRTVGRWARVAKLMAASVIEMDEKKKKPTSFDLEIDCTN